LCLRLLPTKKRGGLVFGLLIRQGQGRATKKATIVRNSRSVVLRGGLVALP